MLLSLDGGFVQFVAGSTLYKQDRAGFLLAELPGGETPKPASWLRGLPADETPFLLSFARELIPLWPGTPTACGFLDRFGHFYRCHRPRIALAAREVRTIAEGLMGLQRWPALFEQILDAMGEPALASLPKGVADADLGAFLGRLLIGAQTGQITLARIPECLRAMCEPPAPDAEECLRIPHNRRMVAKLERATESAARLIERLLEAW